MAGLLAHLAGLAVAFRMAAEKTPVPGQAPPSPEDLPAGWRTRIPADLDALVAAWRRPSAWEGPAEAGGIRMPAPVAATVALDEVLMHGWDLAVVTGQDYAADPASMAACTEFAAQAAAEGPTPGLFGPPVPVPDDATPLHRLLGLTGRDPAWRRPAR